MVTLGLDARSDGQIWHLPTAKKPLTGQQIVEAIAREMNVKPKLTTLDGWLLKILGIFIPILKEMPEMMYQYNQDYVFNSDKYERIFGDVKPISYQSGIAQTALFYIEKK